MKEYRNKNEYEIEYSNTVIEDEVGDIEASDPGHHKNKTKKSKRKKKRAAFFSLVGCLSVLTVACVSVAVFASKAQMKEAELQSSFEAVSDSNLEIQASLIQYSVDDEPKHVDLGELEQEINEIIESTKEITGGEWSVYVYIPDSRDSLSINRKKMQAASVIKLFVMGEVYEEYDALNEKYPDEDIDELLESMITVSDNEATDWLITMLGRGDGSSGRKKVNEFCSSLGLKNTIMDRMMGDDNIVSDNYTSTEDTAMYLDMIYNGNFKHSKDMIKLLEAQTRTMKIPAGVPAEVKTANKTGELDDCQNDAAIVYSKRPYIICVMSDGTSGYQEPIDAIVDISTAAYNYIVKRL